METITVAATTLEHVRQSYVRCRKTDDFFDAFYDNFARKSSAIGALFASTDMNRQNQLLNIAIENLLKFSTGDETAISQIDKIGHSHGNGKLDISADWYILWEESLLETIRETDPEVTSQLLVDWSEILEPGIKRIIELY